MTVLRQIEQAKSISELRMLMYRAETGEEGAAISLREKQLLDAGTCELGEARVLCCEFCGAWASEPCKWRE